MIGTDEIRHVVRAYLHHHPDDGPMLRPLLDALNRPDDPTSRTSFDGHVTCSALVSDPSGRVLHIRHNALGRWLRPGGHLEPDDTGLVNAAIREIHEETGIPGERLRLISELPIDIDVHQIPENPVRGEPEHPHFDLRYAFVVEEQLPVRLQTEKVSDFVWLPTEDVEPLTLRRRILAGA